MQPNRRLVARVLASLVVVLAAGCGSSAPSTVATTPVVQTVAARPPALTPAGLTLADAVRADNDARWYQWASGLPAPVETVARPARRRPAADPGQLDLSGDRFDRLASCESHQNPTDLSPGGKYRGAFQFSLDTWHAAGMAGDPIDYSYADQKATAESWATQADPYGQWPVCWPRSA